MAAGKPVRHMEPDQNIQSGSLSLEYFKPDNQVRRLSGIYS